jgi:hypothetical protein
MTVGELIDQLLLVPSDTLVVVPADRKDDYQTPPLGVHVGVYDDLEGLFTADDLIATLDDEVDWSVYPRAVHLYT